MKRIIRLTESDLVKLVKRVISEQNENTSTPTATLLKTNVLEYTGNLINNVYDGFYSLPQTSGILIGKNINELQNYYGSGTSTKTQQTDEMNSITFQLNKIIQGKNVGQKIDLRLNGKSILSLPIEKSDGIDTKQYYVMNQVKISNLQPGENLITCVVNNKQLDAINFNKFYLKFNVK